MASTYSPLKIELIGTGEQGGTWGITTNTNLGTALEEAITGRATATFPSDANFTLTYTDSNASQVFRNLVLNVTSSGNLSATRDLIIPAIEKQYFVENNTSGSQSIRVKTAAGTGVTIPNGRVANVYCDGTNVRFADDYSILNAGTVALPSLTTTSDTNTGLYFPAADQVALTAGGNQVLRASYSGTTGTVAITGDISVSGAVSGPLLFGNGTVSAPSIAPASDTNTGMYFSAADEISLAAGGYQMTKVVNTGSSTRYTDFRCNLRTAADVEATLEAGRYSSVDGGSTITTHGGSTFLRIEVEDTPRMYIMDTGRVGIGTGIPNAMLHVATTGNETMLLADNGTATAYYVTYASGETAFASNPASGQLMAVGTANDRSLRFITNATERVRVTNGGEVYIAGTTDQGAYNLQVNGTGVWGAGAYVNGSDARLKENVKNIESGLLIVQKIRPVSFKYRQDIGYTKDARTHAGFIAQELQDALNGQEYVEGTIETGGEYLSVAYQSLIPVLTKAIQELKAELDAVKAELAAMKGN